MNEPKQAYREFCEREPSVPLFLTHGWLSTVVPDGNWDIAMVRKGEEIFAVFPYAWQVKWGFRIIVQPELTPYMGPWVKHPEGQKETTKLGFEKKTMYELIEQFPAFSYFVLSFFPFYTNGLPFHWKGFKQSVRYTYVLSDTNDKEALFEGFRQNIRREIKKAEKSITVRSSENILQLYEINKSAYVEKREKLTFDAAHAERIYKYIRENNCGTLLSAEHPEEGIHAMMLLVWDRHYCYYLYGAARPEYKNSGAMSLLMWNAIQIASDKGLPFNFEGSMIEPIERFFRSFGAVQVPYLRLEKHNSLLYRILSSIKRSFS